MKTLRNLSAFLLPAALLAQVPGSLDATFDGDGQLLTTIAGRYRGVAIQPDGKIVAVGAEFLAGGNRRWLVQRFHDDGAPDLSFGTAGVRYMFGSTTSDEASHVAFDAQGRILIAGTSPHGSHVDMTVVRLNGVDGSLDGTFGAGGVVTVHAATKPSNSSWGRGVAVDPSGRVILAGFGTGKKAFDVAVARLTSSGALDTTFGGGTGKTLLDLGTTYDAPWYGSLAVQADSKIIVAAFTGSGAAATGGWNLLRYQSNGTLDSTWGTGGRVDSSFAGFTYPRIQGVLIEPSGRVVASGRARHDAGISGYDFFLARYSSSGVLDTSFNGVGFVNSDFAGDDQAHGGVARQADGGLVLAGTYAGNVRTMRFLSSGPLDTSYGTGGVSEGSSLSFPWSVAIDSAGRSVVAGEYSGAGLVRYLGN